MNTENHNNTTETVAKKKGTDSRKTWILAIIAMVCTIISFIYRYQSGGSDAVTNISKGQSVFAYTLDDVNKVLDYQLKGWNDANIDVFMSGYIKDYSVRFITDKKFKTSWQEITDSYKKGYPDKDAMGKLTFHRDEIRWVNESAYIAQVIGRWEVIQKNKVEQATGSLSQNGKPNPLNQNNNNAPTQDTLSGRFSLIFVGTPEGPKIQIDHTW
jgi:hypothetical protein